jgi:hypothetical protein
MSEEEIFDGARTFAGPPRSKSYGDNQRSLFAVGQTAGYN